MTTEGNILTTAQDYGIYDRVKHLPVLQNCIPEFLAELNCHTLTSATHHSHKGIAGSNRVLVVFSAGMKIAQFIHLLEIGECSLNKHSLAFSSVYTSSEEHTRETVPTIFLPAVHQPVVLPQISIEKTTAAFTWELVVDIGDEMVAVEVVLSKSFFSWPSQLHPAGLLTPQCAAALIVVAENLLCRFDLGQNQLEHAIRRRRWLFPKMGEIETGDR